MSRFKQPAQIVPKPDQGQLNNLVAPTPPSMTPAERKALLVREAGRRRTQKEKEKLKADQTTLVSEAEKLKNAKILFNKKIDEMLTLQPTSSSVDFDFLLQKVTVSETVPAIANSEPQGAGTQTLTMWSGERKSAAERAKDNRESAAKSKAGKLAEKQAITDALEATKRELAVYEARIVTLTKRISALSR